MGSTGGRVANTSGAEPGRVSCFPYGYSKPISQIYVSAKLSDVSTYIEGEFEIPTSPPNKEENLCDWDACNP